jgi:pyruvate dehydrogenase E2 component (dihydrolipoamide acetyltransferase)
MIDFKLPELGENVSAGDVMRVLIKPGDVVANEQAVLELETDKATIEVPSSVAGTVKEVKVKQGEKVKVGQTIFTVDDAGAAAGDAKTSTDKPRPQPEGGPEEGGLSQAATPARETGTSGDADAARDDRESDKPGTADQPQAQTPAQNSGAPRRSAAPRLPEDDIDEAPPREAGRQQKRGEVVDISRAPRTQPGAAPQPEGPAPAAAPSVRRIARELGVDIRQVNGTGAGGRITVDDVQGYVRDALAAGSAAAAPQQAPGAPAAQPLPDFAKWGEVERKPISNIRPRSTSGSRGTRSRT